MTLPFTQKYKPEKCSHIPQKAVENLRQYVENYKKQKKKAALLYGPTGSCKTSSVHALAAENGYELVEVNASDYRNEEGLDQKVGQASQQASLFGSKKIILVDEIDGLSGTKDRGGIPALLDIIAKSKYPIILTANDPWDHKFSKLLSRCTLIEYPAISHTDIVPILKKICIAEGILHTDENISILARRAGGDIRAALNDLHIAAAWLTLQEMPELSVREQTDTMEKTLMKILKTTDSAVSRDALKNMDEDVDELFNWLDENIPKEYLNPADLAAAYDALSKADVFRGRIRRRQHWRLLVFINDLLSAGISHAKSQRYPAMPKYTQPMKGLRIWQLNQKGATRKAIAEKMAELTHTSLRKTMQHTLPCMIAATRANREFAAELACDLGMDEGDIP